jgi:alpha-tubulin suppressor-like RCC1 family protein
MSPIEPTTNFRDSNGVDLGTKLITKDYLISVYPSIGQQIGIPPELWTWGQGSSGQLGTNDTINSNTPTTTSAGGTNWKQASFVLHAAAIKTDGTLWTWGLGSSGQLGTNDTTPNRSNPVTTFAGGTNWKQVDCGDAHTAAIKTDGTLWTWGSQGAGRLGINVTVTNRSTPVTTFAGGNNWKQVSCGSQHTAAIKTDGTLWTWGNGGNGRLGHNSTNNAITPVTTFTGGTNWKQVTTGVDHTAAIKTDGTLWTWGYGVTGALGNGGITSSTPVTTFAGGTNWKQVACGDTFTAAIKTDGTLWTWGFATSGQLGTNSGSVANTPVTTFAGGTNWKQVACGFVHTAAIKTDGTLWTWGGATSGRLGNAITTGFRSTPVTTFAGGTNWKQVQCGSTCTGAIKSVDF